MNDKKKLFTLIQQYSFALTETALYLDTHPTCREALDFFNMFNLKLKEAVCEYETKYGPLTIFGQNDACVWQWTTEPWPWEYECK